MKTTLLVVGRTVEQHFITAINDYIQRTRRYLSFDMEVIPELKNTKSLSMDVQKEKEGELILKALQPGDVVVLLDEGGKEMRSIEFADYMKRKMNMMGMGSRMMRFLMKRKGIDSLESLRSQALAQGVEFIACQMSMDMMGIRREELLDEVTIGGVATYMERADKANVNLFI